MSDSRRGHYLAPATGQDSSEALDAAAAVLARRRGLDGPADASVRLHLLVSLVAEAQSRLPAAVAEARAERCSWSQVADLLGVSRASAWQRYGEQHNKPHTPGSGR